MRPSGRTIWWLLVSALCLMTAPLLPLLLWIGLGSVVLLLVLLATDMLLLRAARAVHARRAHEDILSLGTANPVTITVENPTVIPLYIALRDIPPEQCDGEETSSAGSLNALGSFRYTYHLTPLRRGECAFGPLTVRMKSSLGFCWLQRVLVSGGSVKVYPNIHADEAATVALQTLAITPDGPARHAPARARHGIRITARLSTR